MDRNAGAWKITGSPHRFKGAYTTGIDSANTEAYNRAIEKVLGQLAGAGAERSTTDRPSDATPAVSHGGRAHPTAPAIPYVALPEGAIADFCSGFLSESISIEHYDPIL